MMTLAYLRSLFGNRRRVSLPVPVNRRSGWHRTRDTDRQVRDAIDRLSETIARHGNDTECVEATIEWAAFYPSCTHGMRAGNGLLCRHPAHRGSGNGAPAFCVEEQCPILHRIPAAA